MAATIATSSVIPYMWIDSGPMSIVPVEGDGKLAMRFSTGRHSALLPPPRLREELAEPLGRG